MEIVKLTEEIVILVMGIMRLLMAHIIFSLKCNLNLKLVMIFSEEIFSFKETHISKEILIKMNFIISLRDWKAQHNFTLEITHLQKFEPRQVMIFLKVMKKLTLIEVKAYYKLIMRALTIILDQNA